MRNNRDVMKPMVGPREDGGVAPESTGIDPRRGRQHCTAQTKKPLIPEQDQRLRIWLRGQDLNL
jgi:hypothetical protein